MFCPLGLPGTGHSQRRRPEGARSRRQRFVRHMETAATRDANKIGIKRHSKGPESYANYRLARALRARGRQSKRYLRTLLPGAGSRDAVSCAFRPIGWASPRRRMRPIVSSHNSPRSLGLVATRSRLAVRTAKRLARRHQSVWLRRFSPNASAGIVDGYQIGRRPAKPWASFTTTPQS